MRLGATRGARGWLGEARELDRSLAFEANGRKLLVTHDDIAVIIELIPRNDVLRIDRAYALHGLRVVHTLSRGLMNLIEMNLVAPVFGGKNLDGNRYER